MAGAVFTTERAARKPHKCSRCLRTINPGERYVSYVITPGHLDIGNSGWLRGSGHLTAADCYPKEI